MRHLCRALPASEHRVVYLSDCTVKPLDLYRMLAIELGLRPGPRAQIVTDIKQALVSLVDERGIVPVIVLDDAQGLRDELLRELHGLTSLDFDGRDYLTVWLVGHPLLARRLRLQQHAALAQRIVWYAPMVAKTDPQLFGAMLDHGLTAAAAPLDLITSDARDLILRVSRGIPRLISHLLRISLVLADERGLSSIDVSVVNSAAIVLHLESTRPAAPPSLLAFPATRHPHPLSSATASSVAAAPPAPTRRHRRGAGSGSRSSSGSRDPHRRPFDV